MDGATAPRHDVAEEGGGATKSASKPDGAATES
jgi:hypothetical protein